MRRRRVRRNSGRGGGRHVAREGKKAVQLSFNRHVGGMTSGGLTATDLGRKDAIVGLDLEF